MPFISRKKLNGLHENLLLLKGEVDKIKKDFYVEDFFSFCPEGGPEKVEMLKSESKSFIKKVFCVSVFGSGYRVKTLYTSKENYKSHKPLIDKYKKEVKDYNNSKK